MRRRPPRPSGNAFTLIEVCVALGIVALGILTAMTILISSLQQAATAKRDFMAADAAMSAVGFLNAGGTLSGDALVSYVDVGSYRVYPSNPVIPANTRLTTPHLRVTMTVKSKRWDPATGTHVAPKTSDPVELVTIVNLCPDH